MDIFPKPFLPPRSIPPSDKSKDLDKWFIFPDSLQNARFRGYETRDDETQNRGAFVIGQNTSMSLAQTPTLRQGWEPVGTEATDATPVQRAWVYETRDGVQFEIKAYSTFLYYLAHGLTTDWKLLKGGFTSGLEFGYGNIGKSANLYGACFFGNGTDNWYQFNGAYATVASVTANTITISGSTTFTNLNFYTTGTRSVIIEGVEYAYTGGEGTQTITGVTPDPSAGGVVAGNFLVQSPQALNAAPPGDLSSFKGQVVMAHDGRLHSRQETKKSVWNYSDLDDPYSHTAGSSDTNAGSKEVEFGGGIVAFGKLNKVAIALKPRMIKMLEFIQVGSRVDSPQYKTLVSVDDKGTTLGATNQRSTFSTPFGLVFVTPDKKMILLTGVTANNEPQFQILSDPIQQVFSQGVHNDAAGICVDNFIYYTYKADANSTFNDTLLRGNMLRQTFDAQGKALPIMWDTPTTGINAKDFTAVYNSSLKKNEVHFHSSLNSSSYRFIDNKTDNTASFTSTIRTWAEPFGYPQHQKRIDECFIEVKMLPNTELTATLLYDINGSSGSPTYSLLGTSTDNLINGAVYNPFGASAFGSQKIGSNPQQTDLQRYIFDLEINPNIRFFNISLQLSGDIENNDFELVRFGYRLTEVIKEMDRKFKTNTN